MPKARVEIEIEVPVTLAFLMQNEIIREWKEPIKCNGELFGRAKDAYYEYGDREVESISASKGYDPVLEIILVGDSNA